MKSFSRASDEPIMKRQEMDMSVQIKIDGAVKKYGDNVVIPGLDLTIREGEFFTLLGPSGCGKTTLLRMIAGFNSIEGGQFFFNDTLINDLDPARRNIGMVFQNYAIFPNMTVRKNVAFGLTNRKLDKAVVDERTSRFLELMKISEYADRMPERLSGGQQQRVALARALAVEPDVLLMDEPLSNLDAKLRLEMRSVIKEIQNKLGITTVYVTHDQEEAMAISDRIAVMNRGVIQQIGSPKELYLRPQNTFVANFVGTSNFINAKVFRKEGLMGVVFPDGHEVVLEKLCSTLEDGQSVIVCVRPEEFVISESGIEAEITDSSFLGLNTHIFAQLSTGENVAITQESTFDSNLNKGQKIFLTVKAEKINVFSEDGSKPLLER